jgi:hypothetical protein
MRQRSPWQTPGQDCTILNNDCCLMFAVVGMKMGGVVLPVVHPDHFWLEHASCDEDGVHTNEEELRAFTLDVFSPLPEPTQCFF